MVTGTRVGDGRGHLRGGLARMSDMGAGGKGWEVGLGSR